MLDNYKKKHFTFIMISTHFIIFPKNQDIPNKAYNCGLKVGREYVVDRYVW